MDVIYLDVLFITNFVLDYIILLCSGIFCKIKIHRIRIMISAFVGAIYACVSFTHNLLWLNSSPMQFFTAVLLCFMAYGSDIRFSPICICHIILSAMIGGLFTAFSETNQTVIYAHFNLKTALLVFTVVFAFSHLMNRYLRTAQKRIHRVTITVFGNSTTFLALLDTGNSLVDPITAKPIMVCDRYILQALIPNITTNSDIHTSYDMFSLLPTEACIKANAHLIPFHSLGGNGMLIGVTPESIKINQQSANLVVAFTDTDFSKNQIYHGIF